MLVLRHASQVVGVTPPDACRKTGRDLARLEVIPDGAVAIEGERITWVGPTAELPAWPLQVGVVNLHGQIAVPGLVDSHTHLIFAGERAGEFELRLQGVSYQEITARGGGIQSTVNCVRKATRGELVELARPRLERLLRFGVTTVEVK